MRQTRIFSGSSHPALVEVICERLGKKPDQVQLGKFANGETSVQIQTSIRNQDVFIVQSGSSMINDNIMELLIMISACKGGSAKSITAVLPYFPYSRQSKKKSHRGAITARMIANLLNVAGVNHVITIDLHASQMQGFFKCPVDNLVAEPLIARWIKHNVVNWKQAVIVSKNAGGTKRVTALADALKLSFGIVTTDRRRSGYVPHSDFSVNGSLIFDRLAGGGSRSGVSDHEEDARTEMQPHPEDRSDKSDKTTGEKAPSDTTTGEKTPEHTPEHTPPEEKPATDGAEKPESVVGAGSASVTSSSGRVSRTRNRGPSISRHTHGPSSGVPPSPLAKSTLSHPSPSPSPTPSLMRVSTAPMATASHGESVSEEFTDERARNVIHGRLVHGHIVDEDYPSPASFHSGSVHRGRGGSEEDPPDNMMASFLSTVSSLRQGAEMTALGGSLDAGTVSEDEEEDLKNPEFETTATLVGDVKDRPVILLDDIIDKAGSWIAAAETVVKRGGATKVYCVATHGLFGGTALEELEECGCIEGIVVTNSFPIPPERRARCKKLVMLDVAPLLAEAIRRNHNGESISQLFMHFAD
ncbi:phosphoribosyl pyrophosphokinase [Trichodelitschia bisporula]|uniref:Ribose-phosphate pyrophosphokinase 1 n=1 Tax=Trichodelitschia bisporula TaxID=703511 RepID=A0A6G1HZZ6_9PEZI|nr:phosphoribosyl pyrophosphokinase [Trichodelitschia bisporula]